MQSGEKLRFKKCDKFNEGVSIVLPPFWSMIKILLDTIILYPWYYAIPKRRGMDKIMNYIFYRPKRNRSMTSTPQDDDDLYANK